MSHLERTISALHERFPHAVLGEAEFRGDITVQIDRTSLVAVCRYLRDEPAAEDGGAGRVNDAVVVVLISVTLGDAATVNAGFSVDPPASVRGSVAAVN